MSFHLVNASYLFVRCHSEFQKHHTKKSSENNIDPIISRQIEILLIDEKTEKYGYAWQQRNKVDDMKYFSYFLPGSVLLYLQRKIIISINFSLKRKHNSGLDIQKVSSVGTNSFR
jgi:hypothetical protein